MGRSAYNPDTAGKYLIRKRGEAVLLHRLSLFFFYPLLAIWARMDDNKIQQSIQFCNGVIL